MQTPGGDRPPVRVCYRSPSARTRRAWRPRPQGPGSASRWRDPPRTRPRPLLHGIVTLTDDRVHALGEGDAVVWDGVWDEARCRALLASLEQLDASGAMVPAGVGRSARIDPSVRGDRITWLSHHLDQPGLREVWELFDGLRSEANATAWLGLQRFAVQVACYPGHGARYVRHRDALRDDPARRLTAILYLNPDWRPEHGGLLRVHGPQGPRDIEPLAGRLVAFLAGELEHEVLPVHAPRWAVTAWFRGPSQTPWLPDPEVLAG